MYVINSNYGQISIDQQHKSLIHGGGNGRIDRISDEALQQLIEETIKEVNTELRTSQVLAPSQVTAVKTPPVISDVNNPPVTVSVSHGQAEFTSANIRVDVTASNSQVQSAANIPVGANTANRPVQNASPRIGLPAFMPLSPVLWLPAYMPLSPMFWLPTYMSPWLFVETTRH